MMKKLLMLLLILGLTSALQAGTAVLVVNAGSTVAAGNTIQIDLVADFDCIGFEMGLVGSSDTAGTTSGSPGYNGPVSSNVGLIDAGYTINSTQGGYGLLFDAAAGGGGSAVTAGNIIASFDYNIPSGWTGSAFSIEMMPTTTAYTDGYGTPYASAGVSYASDATGSYPITGLPEPMTIALLGLGGLFLRRRK